MKKIKIGMAASALVFAGVLAIGGLGHINAQNDADPFKVGEKFSVKELKMKEKAYVIDYKSEDVNGDKIKDSIVLVGDKEEKVGIYADNLTIVIQDGATKKYSKIAQESFGGYGGELFIGDFSGDKVKDIMVSAGTGGSGGIVNHLIATFKENKPTIIFGEKENEGLKLEGKFVDGFKAEIKFKDINKKITLDLSSNKEYYIEGNIYDTNGKLLTDVEPWIDAYSYLKPFEYGDGSVELIGNQSISGSCHADRISNIETTLKYENGKWNIKEASYSTILVK